MRSPDGIYRKVRIIRRIVNARTASAEISLEQSLESLAMAGLVTCHLMYGIVDRVKSFFLRSLRKKSLALGRAALGVNAHLEILLRAVGHDLTEELRKLCGMLSLFESRLSQ